MRREIEQFEQEEEVRSPEARKRERRRTVRSGEAIPVDRWPSFLTNTAHVRTRERRARGIVEETPLAHAERTRGWAGGDRILEGTHALPLAPNIIA